MNLPKTTTPRADRLEWVLWAMVLLLGAWAWMQGLGLSTKAALLPYLTTMFVGLALMWVLSRHLTPWRGASRLTWVRAQITVWLMSLLWVPQVYQSHGLWLGLLGLAALLLDGLDGWWARRFGQTTTAGARFDMETDAALILVLSLAVWLSGLAGAWVLAIGWMRYAFVLAQSIWPWLGGSLPPSLRRRVICVVQVSVLLLVLPRWFGDGLSHAILGVGLVLLTLSFLIDTLWLWRHRHHSMEALKS
jgi:phosphatidylglycerophosphate synthase